MKKVLFVASVVKKHINVFHVPYLKWFKDNGYETYVCARNDYEDIKECIIPYCDHYIDVPFERSPIKLKNIKAYRILKRLVEQNNFDVIHCHTPIGGVITRLATKNVRKLGTRIIYTAHGFHFFKGAPLRNWLLYYPVEKYLAASTDVLITINKEDFQIAKSSFRAERIEFIHGVGIDTLKIVKKKSNNSIRKEIGLSDDKIILLSVGELSSRKNHETSIKAFAQINRQDIVYIICGSGPLNHYLINLCEELNIRDKVIFLGHRDDIYSIYSIADIFVFPSLQEGLPVAIMEAMSSGLPVVCSKVRGNTDLIEDEIGGFLVESQNISEFSTKIERLIIDSELRNRMGRENSKKARSYDISIIKDTMALVYDTQK